jgi:hypothetical protein
LTVPVGSTHAQSSSPNGKKCAVARWKDDGETMTAESKLLYSYSRVA